MKVTLNGCSVDFDACVTLMDDELRETLHNSLLVNVTEQEFLDMYCVAHEALFDETFEI